MTAHEIWSLKWSNESQPDADCAASSNEWTSSDDTNSSKWSVFSNKQWSITLWANS